MIILSVYEFKEAGLCEKPTPVSIESSRLHLLIVDQALGIAHGRTIAPVLIVEDK